jgi:hypothetical protein
MLLTTALVLAVGSAVAIATGQVDIKTLQKAAAGKATDVKTAAAETAAATKDLAVTIVSATAEKVGEVADKVGGGASSADEVAQVRLDWIRRDARGSPRFSCGLVICTCTPWKLLSMETALHENCSPWKAN